MKMYTILNPIFIVKIVLTRDFNIFLIFAPKHRLSGPDIKWGVFDDKDNFADFMSMHNIRHSKIILKLSSNTPLIWSSTGLSPR